MKISPDSWLTNLFSKQDGVLRIAFFTLLTFKWFTLKIKLSKQNVKEVRQLVQNFQEGVL